MKKHLLVALFSLLATDAFSQFEGIIESKNATADDNGALQHYIMTMWIRKGMVRLEIPESGANQATTVIYRSDRELSWVLDESSRTYFEIPRNDSSVGDLPQTAEKSRIRKTGKKKTMLGYPCEQIFMKMGDAETELWVTSSLKALAKQIVEALGGTEADPGSGWNDEIAKLGLFPITAVTRIDGKIIEASEVTLIRKTTVDLGKFELPVGYAKQKVDQMR
jgi:hypothetical protein